LTNVRRVLGVIERTPAATRRLSPMVGAARHQRTVTREMRDKVVKPTRNYLTGLERDKTYD
jgi:hypothetical protein